MRKEYIAGAALFIIAILLVIANIAYADSKHGSIAVTNTISNVTTNNLSGTASAIAASQHQFNYGVLSWQGSVAIGAYDSTTAFSFGLGKRFNKTLINGSISNEEGKFGGGIGVNFTF